MKKRLLTILLVILSFTIVLSGCVSKGKEEENSLSKQVAELREKNLALEKQVEELKKSEEELKNKLNSVGQKEQVELIVYTANVDTLKPQVLAKVSVDKNAALKDKLSILAKKLSETEFKNLPIEVMNIEKVNNKQIAVINLKESAENQGVKDYSKLKGTTWITGRFQGSTGGSITYNSLVETFLQKNYTGEWIDGVKFLYNGEIIQVGHVEGLSEVNYR